MIKSKELAEPTSCINKAHATEPVFVLIARDPAASQTVRKWCDERISMGKNTVTDPQIVEALHLATEMDTWRAMMCDTPGIMLPGIPHRPV